MDRQVITFCMTVAGNVCNSISNKIVYYLKHDATYKVILQTPSRQQRVTCWLLQRKLCPRTRSTVMLFPSPAAPV
jgi:hypothetical protein